MYIAEIKQEIDELEAAKVVENTIEDVISTGVELEKGMKTWPSNIWHGHLASCDFYMCQTHLIHYCSSLHRCSLDMEKVVDNVVSSLRDAEDAVQAALAAVEGKDGLTDEAKSELQSNLEEKAKNIEESIKGKK